MTLDLVLSFLVVGALLSVLGKGFSGLVFNGKPRAGLKGWRGVWYVTLPLHAVLVGGVLGVAAKTLPVPPGMGEGVAGRVLWYALSGALGVVSYDVLKGIIKHQAAAKSGDDA